MATIQTESFITRDVDSVSLRVGRSKFRYFREVNRKDPLTTICFVEVTGLPALAGDRKVTALMRVLQVGYDILRKEVQ